MHKGCNLVFDSSDTASGSTIGTKTSGTTTSMDIVASTSLPNLPQASNPVDWSELAALLGQAQSGAPRVICAPLLQFHDAIERYR